MPKTIHTLQFILISVLFTLPLFCLAQERTITGIVLDEDGFSLIGANVLTPQTTFGTVSDLDGKFELTITEEISQIEISYIGYTTKIVELTAQTFYEIILTKNQTDTKKLIVTALGIKRDEVALGYSVQKLEAADIARVKPSNMISTLSGKVSGIYISESAAGPSASSNINIRGVASLLGNNQPLFVINGTPITNELYSFDDGLNGSTSIDFGNAAQTINPDDVASVNILKGPAASALYGARAADGVIIIETKTGSNAKGWGLSLNSSTLFSSILKMPDYQNKYGFGGGGKYSYLDGSNYIGDKEYYEAYGENWGPQLNGQNIVQFNSEGQPVPFTTASNNVKNFFQTGITSINNIALNNANQNSDFRLSYTNLNKKGIVPNTNLKRNTIQTSIGKKLFADKLALRANAIYINAASKNIPNTGYDESSSIQYGWLWFPRQVAIENLENYWQPGQEGVQQQYVENLWVNNPWFIANENTNAFQNNRLISNIQFKYTLPFRSSLQVTYSSDVFREKRQYRRAPSTKAVLLGSYKEESIDFSETNTEILFSHSSNRDNEAALQYDLKIGGNIMRQNTNYFVANNPQLKFFGTEDNIYTLSNARSGILVGFQKDRLGINSVFGLASIYYKNFLFSDITFRNDWSSTLVNPILGSKNSNFSFAYPSVSLSLVLSELINFQRYTPISLLKLKTNYAEVGNGAPPHVFGTTFTPQAAFGNYSVFTSNKTVADPNLTNEKTRAYEIGGELRLWKNRVYLDATYYNMLSYNQIIELPVASSSGYNFKLTNGGAIRNKGLEVLLGGRAITNTRFAWDVSLNLGHNRAIVESLPDIIASGRYSIIADLFPGDEGGADLEFVAEEGELFGQLYGLGFVRHPETNEIIHKDGLPLVSEAKVSAGSYQPDLRLGLLNTFQINNFYISALIDGQIGGKIYSRSHALYATGGTITNNNDPNLSISTLDGRQSYSVSYNSSGEPVYTLEEAGAGVVGPGLNWVDTNEDGEINFDTELSPNDVAVQPGGIGYAGYFYNYYGNGFNRDNIEAATYDATYFKLRELSIAYKIPEQLLERFSIANAQVALIGRNLLLFSKVPTIDPETYSIRNGLFVPGFESTQLFSTRSYGLSLNISF